MDQMDPRAMAQRQKQMWACDVCYKRKLKCDAQQPLCSNCAKSGVPCTYNRRFDPTLVNRPKKTSAKASAETTAQEYERAFQELEKRILSIESMVRPLLLSSQEESGRDKKRVRLTSNSTSLGGAGGVGGSSVSGDSVANGAFSDIAGRGYAIGYRDEVDVTALNTGHAAFGGYADLYDQPLTGPPAVVSNSPYSVSVPGAFDPSMFELPGSSASWGFQVPPDLSVAGLPDYLQQVLAQQQQQQQHESNPQQQQSNPEQIQPPQVIPSDVNSFLDTVSNAGTLSSTDASTTPSNTLTPSQLAYITRALTSNTTVASLLTLGGNSKYVNSAGKRIDNFEKPENFLLKDFSVHRLTDVLDLPEVYFSGIMEMFFRYSTRFPLSFINRQNFMPPHNRTHKPLLLNAIGALTTLTGRGLVEWPRGGNIWEDLWQHREIAMEIFFQKARSLVDYESIPDLEDVQAMMLLSLFCQLTARTSLAWMYGGIASRMAIMMKLNLDPEELVRQGFSQPMSWLESETRRRTWWCLYTMDQFDAGFLGRSSGISRAKSEVKLPSSDLLWYSVKSDETPHINTITMPPPTQDYSMAGISLAALFRRLGDVIFDHNTNTNATATASQSNISSMSTDLTSSSSPAPFPTQTPEFDLLDTDLIKWYNSLPYECRNVESIEKLHSAARNIPSTPIEVLTSQCNPQNTVAAEPLPASGNPTPLVAGGCFSLDPRSVDPPHFIVASWCLLHATCRLLLHRSRLIAEIRRRSFGGGNGGAGGEGSVKAETMSGSPAPSWTGSGIGVCGGQRVMDLESFNVCRDSAFRITRLLQAYYVRVVMVTSQSDNQSAGNNGQQPQDDEEIVVAADSLIHLASANDAYAVLEAALMHVLVGTIAESEGDVALAEECTRSVEVHRRFLKVLGRRLMVVRKMEESIANVTQNLRYSMGELGSVSPSPGFSTPLTTSVMSPNVTASSLASPSSFASNSHLPPGLAWIDDWEKEDWLTMYQQHKVND
ncbi:hypothetical protein HDU76_001100 [Blyttiomyces sp. JEL0837]|nr:hypothetical protein HDU76_001100 [Blyttiomyces sp. JEL0837]